MFWACMNQRYLHWGGEPVWLLVLNRMVINKFERTSWTGRPTHKQQRHKMMQPGGKRDNYLHTFIRDTVDMKSGSGQTGSG